MPETIASPKRTTRDPQQTRGRLERWLDATARCTGHVALEPVRDRYVERDAAVRRDLERSRRAALRGLRRARRAGSERRAGFFRATTSRRSSG